MRDDLPKRHVRWTVRNNSLQEMFNSLRERHNDHSKIEPLERFDSPPRVFRLGQTLQQFFWEALQTGVLTNNGFPRLVELLLTQRRILFPLTFMCRPQQIIILTSSLQIRS